MKFSFKAFRRNTLSESKVGKYALYALGEIALVVIGILIAISIDDWLENRKNKKDEQYYIAALKEEFEFNKQSLQSLIDLNATNVVYGLEILKLSGPEKPMVSENYFDSLLVYTLGFEVQFRPRSEIADEVIASGKLHLFQNPQLRTSLSSWAGALAGLRFQEEELSKYRFQLLDLAVQEINMRNAIFYGTHDLFNTGQSRFGRNNLQLLASQEFESGLTYFIGASNFMDDRLVRLQTRINKILAELEAGLAAP